jgi:hypothetical protein
MTFLSYARPRNGVGRIRINIVPISEVTAGYWDTHIRPFTLADPSRPDQNWKWRRILARSSPFARVLGRVMRGIAVLTEGADGQNVVVAQMACTFPYSLPISGTFLYVWYLAAAPTNAMTNLGVANPPGLGHVLTDSAIQISLELGFGGRTILHAAPKGGQGLVDIYVKLGFQCVPESQEIPNRTNDGRFFWIPTESHARSIVKLLDGWR